MPELRVVIDTSVVVSAALLPNSVPRGAIDHALDRGRLLQSIATLEELKEVLRRPGFNRYISEGLRLEFLGALVQQSEIVEVSERIVACRDKMDNKFLELAVSGGATHVVTGDNDLLVLSPFRGIAICTPARFVEQCGHEQKEKEV